jgi:hypothetical protein
MHEIPKIIRILSTIHSTVIRFLFAPLGVLLYLCLGGPFIRRGEIHQKAYQATLGERQKMNRYGNALSIFRHR